MIRALSFAALMFICAGAWAQLRAIPADAKRAEIRHLSELVVELNGTPARLAPGALVRDADNRIVVPSAIPPGSLVKYLLGAQNEIVRVWILTPAEAAQSDRP